MDEDLMRVADYFEPYDLVQLLGLSAAEIVQAFEDEVRDALEDLEDIMEFKRTESE